VSSIAVEKAERVFGTLQGRSVLVVGTGDMAEKALNAFKGKGVRAPYVVSHSRERAAATAERFGGISLTLMELAGALPKADLVLISSDAPHYVLGAEDFRSALKERGGQPMFVIDISVPRNVDPAARDVEGVHLYDIDELEEIASQNLAGREGELAKCWEIIDEAAARCYGKLHSLELSKVVEGLRAAFETVRSEELSQLLQRLNDLTEEQKAEIRRMTERYQNRLLHYPLSALREENGHGRGEQLVETIIRIFGLGR
jgi:glutamyl-tRNA reductase